MQSDALNEELRKEQDFVDTAYEVLDELRKRYREHQRTAEASKWRNTPQALTERDAFAAHWGDEASRLESIVDGLVFGRIDNTDDSTHYIGRIGLRDQGGDQILIDWRAPASRPFYQATGANPQDVVRRRHIRTRGRAVIGVEDELLNTDSKPDGKLVFQGEGALMQALSEARDGQMSDIVSTIQAEQDAIIRRGSDGLLVIQGGPGTGKTAVALHRAAYLLYAERARLESSGVLIVGPSNIFLRYIDQVLPSLGENGVVSTTIGRLLPGYSPRAHESAQAREIKGRMAWVDIAKRAVRSFERVPNDTPLSIASYRVTLRSETVKAARASARRSGKPHNEAWEGFALELMDDLARQMNEQVGASEHLSWYHDYIRGSKEARRAINLAWLPVSALQVLEKLYANETFLEQMAPELTESERATIRRLRGSALTESDIPILDELEELLGALPSASASANAREQARKREIDAAGEAIAAMGLGHGMVSASMLAERAAGEGSDLTLSQRALRDRTWAYGHVIVDEAQELSPLAWNSLLRRCPSRSFTVTGDLDQRSSAGRAKSWSDVLGPAMRAYQGEEILTVSYRTPAAILDRANALMDELGTPAHYPLVAARDVVDAYAKTTTGGSVQELQAVVKAEDAMLSKRVGAGNGRIAVIASPTSIRHLREACGWGSSLDERICLITPVESKGLEFDTVILWEPNEIIADSPGDIYVALTRPTYRLHAVSSSPLPNALV
ncbi:MULTISPECIES: AAA family ATPase [unclassified Actinomyces]|uniref:HelD family protein n=1 Tax=unclassified Actinomyces TaxID=2609248 RepID=UPI0008D6CAC7|nr:MULTISPECIES: AAA family ATPase [unclassified Actinomyces]MDU5568710.1 AAA family ATPase [Actinomyces sp.]OFJ63414.1 ATP-dependent DNA helicase [Actinomyces sp. HMSC075B09]OFR31753.1 ATP-dependent DNA helicase [Actinomyces sp. HMSC065F11]